MTWLAWRQLRAQAAVVYAAVVLLAALLAATGPGLARQYHARGSRFLYGIHGPDSVLYLAAALALLALPAIIGMFWGAPLVTRELDAGTHRLTWTMTTRTRWLLARLGLTGLAAVGAAGLLSLALTWWASPIDAAVAARGGQPGPGLFIFTRFSPEMFDARGIVPLGYAAFMFVLGVAIGLLVRRTLPAMALLLVAFAVVQIGISVLIRPHLAAPEHATVTVTTRNFLNYSFGGITVLPGRGGAWVTGQQTIDAAGRAGLPGWMGPCLMRPDSSMTACIAKFTRLGYRQLISYQPAARFWAFQLDETVLYLVLALLVAGLCTWWVQRRVS